jgi:hypothetical protein
VRGGAQSSASPLLAYSLAWQSQLAPATFGELVGCSAAKAIAAAASIFSTISIELLDDLPLCARSAIATRAIGFRRGSGLEHRKRNGCRSEQFAQH